MAEVTVEIVTALCGEISIYCSSDLVMSCSLGPSLLCYLVAVFYLVALVLVYITRYHLC